MIKLLFIDDDKELTSINEKYFSRLGYEVKSCNHPENALNTILSYHPDCIILDVMMPQQDGFSLCDEIKKIYSVPIIFLSGATSEEQRIRGLLIGGNDYMLKPYSMKELSARIQVQLRNKTDSALSQRIHFPPLSLDTALHKAYIYEEEVLLSNREFELLYLLIKHPNQTVTFEEIGQSIWGKYMDSDRKTIMVTYSRLRKKLEAHEIIKNRFETVWSKGYKFIVH